MQIRGGAASIVRFVTRPFVFNAVVSSMIGLLLLSDISISLFTDGNVPAWGYVAKNVVGGVLIMAGCVFGIACFYQQRKDTEGLIWADILLMLDRYSLYAIFLFCVVALMRLFFGREGGLDTLYPLYAEFDVKPFSFWMLGSLIVAGLWIYGLSRFFEVTIGERDSAFLLYLWLGACLIPFTLALTDGGIRGLTLQFDNEGMQYQEDSLTIARLGVLRFLSQFNEIQSTLSYHSTSHPPGPSIFYYLGYKLFGYSHVLFAIQTIGVAALTIVPVFFLLQEVAGRSVALLGAPVLVVTPSYLIFSATSFDAVLLFISAVSMTTFYYALIKKNFLWVVGASLSIAVYAVTTFHFLVMGALFVMLPLLLSREKQTWEPFFKSIVVGLGVVSLGIVCFLITGYSYLDSFMQTLGVVDQRNPVLSLQGYATIFVGNLLAFLIYTGIATGGTIFAFAGSLRSALAANGVARILGMVLLVIVSVMNITMFGHYETERVWLFLLPFCLVPLGLVLSSQVDGVKPRVPFYTMLTVLFLQAWAFQILLYTRW